MRWFGSGKSDEDIKRAMIRRYFAPDKGPPPDLFTAAGIASLVLMGVLLLLPVPGWTALVAAILAVVLLAVAWVLFSERAERATDEDIDFWRDEDFDRVVAAALEDADLARDEGIDPGDPIVIAGLPRFDRLKVRRSGDGDAPPAWRFKVKVGADGITRYTPPSLTVLTFTKDHLIAYQCDLDLISGRALNESIEEFFWQDIATLQIDKQTLAAGSDELALFAQWARDMPRAKAARFAALFAENGRELPTGKRTVLRLKTNTGGGLEIVVADERFADNPNDPVQARNDEAIARLRQLLRDRKARR